MFFSKLFFEDGKKARFWNFYKCKFVRLASENMGWGWGGGGGASEILHYEGDKFEIDVVPYSTYTVYPHGSYRRLCIMEKLKKKKKKKNEKKSKILKKKFEKVKIIQIT